MAAADHAEEVAAVVVAYRAETTPLGRIAALNDPRFSLAARLLASHELGKVPPSDARTLELVDGTTVSAWIAADGSPVVQIDTDGERDDADDHADRVRVYVNDARAVAWREA